MVYGDKRDYPRIDLYVSGIYARYTTWARNLQQARLIHSVNYGIPEDQITAVFNKEVQP